MIREPRSRQVYVKPSLRRVDVQAIIKYRSLIGKIDSLTELILNNILSQSVAERLRRYLIFR